MTVRPVLLAAAFLGAVAVHAAIFFQYDAREERGAATDGDEGILVALGTPAQTGVGGEDDTDQDAEVESNPESETPEAETTETVDPETAAIEPAPQEVQDTPVEDPAEAQPENVLPEAASVEIPQDTTPEEISADEPDSVTDPSVETSDPEPIAAAPNTEVALEPDQPDFDPSQNAEIVPDDLDPPAETSVAAVPLPQFRPEPPQSTRQATPRPRQQPQEPAQSPANTEPRRSSGAVSSGNTSSESRQAQTGGGNDAERASYLSRLHSQLVRSKRYPQSARREGIEGVVQIGLIINREGRVTVFRITRSSGHEVLDQEVRDMVSRVQPLPRMPASMDQDRITINMAIRFKIE